MFCMSDRDNTGTMSDRDATGTAAAPGLAATVTLAAAIEVTNKIKAVAAPRVTAVLDNIVPRT